jgi:hypothetical protein
MRKILVFILIILALVVWWLWRGRDVVTIADRLKTIEASSQPVTSIRYDGSGTGGILHIAETDLTLDETKLGDTKPNVGTTKDGQLALSFHGKVFPFGPASSQDDKLAANLPGGESATISIEHSAAAWPNFFEVNFMTGNSPKWKRYIYRKLSWRKASGAKLEMLWRYEQFFYGNDGWVEAFMVRPEYTGLIRVEISEPSR